jgi:hypothetical protein
MDQNRRTPQTIQELKEWSEANNLPLKDMRVFIGIDYRQPKVFGIYESRPGHFIVYKNKDTGIRTIRYEGEDEAHAVNELYLKMKELIAQQKSFIKIEEKEFDKKAKGKNSKKKRIIITSVAIYVVAIIIISSFGTLIDSLIFKSSGYYSYKDTYYYRLDNSWYFYDSYDDDWYGVDSVDSELNDNYKNYYEGKSIDKTAGYSDFKDTQYYENWKNNDSDSNWNSNDSWDSDLTDWGSDW